MLSFKVQYDGSTDNRSYQGDDPYIFGMTPSKVHVSVYIHLFLT